jgi:hypothetical protein
MSQFHPKSCKVIDYNAAKDRYHVKFSEGQVASLSCENVILPKDTRVCVVGLENDVSLNGKWGKVQYYSSKRVNLFVFPHFLIFFQVYCDLF